MSDPDTDTMDEADDFAEVEVDEELMYRLREAQQTFDEAKAYLYEVKTEVKTTYKGMGKLRAVCDGEPVFTYTTYDTTRINSRKLKRDYPDIWQAYATTYTHERLAVARPKAES
jgi:hypothetical protein